MLLSLSCDGTLCIVRQYWQVLAVQGRLGIQPGLLAGQQPLKPAQGAVDALHLQHIRLELVKHLLDVLCKICT